MQLDPRPEAGVVVFEIGEAQFGVVVDRVQEVIRVPTITRLPFPPRSVAGVISLRGAILPVLDLGELLLGAPSRRDGRLIVVNDESTRSRIALLVNQVLDLVSGELESRDPLPETIESLPEGSVQAMISPTPDRSILLLNLDLVLGGIARRTEEPR